MKSTGIILLVAGLAFAITRGVMRMSAGAEYTRLAKNYWAMADRASTIKQKSEYMDKFVKAVGSMALEGYNSDLLYPTQKGDFNENFKALKSLQSRLHEISAMDESSFAYQTAMHQITEQEQGQADEMLSVIHECWGRKNYYTLWNPVLSITFFLIQGLMILIGGVALFEDF
jgi:hypothetical protein